MDLRETINEAVNSLRVKTKKSSWWTKWIWYLLAGSLGLLLIAYLVYETMSKSQKAARALHKLDVLEEKHNQEKANAIVAESKKKQEQHIAKADKHKAKADKQAVKAVKLQEQADKNQKIIDNLRSWDDVQKRVKW